jgi:hypothetical protein
VVNQTLRQPPRPLLGQVRLARHAVQVQRWPATPVLGDLAGDDAGVTMPHDDRAAQVALFQDREHVVDVGLKPETSASPSSSPDSVTG